MSPVAGGGSGAKNEYRRSLGANWFLQTFVSGGGSNPALPGLRGSTGAGGATGPRGRALTIVSACETVAPAAVTRVSVCVPGESVGDGTTTARLERMGSSEITRDTVAD